jgi:hypothetical protein
MKFASAAALASTSAFAGNALFDQVHDRVFATLGLTPEEPQHVKEMNQLVASVQDKPVVKMYGDQDFACIDNDTDCNIAWYWQWNADVGYGTHFPMYAEEDNLIARQRVSAIAGGRQHFWFQAYVYRINLYLDTYLANLTLDNYLSYDAVNRENFCYAGNWFLDIARIALLLQVDVRQCKHGALGYLSDEISACDWTTYYIMKPLWQKMLNDTERGELYGNCEDEIPAYGY